MTDRDATAILGHSIQLVRTGEFTTLYRDEKLAELKSVRAAHSEDYLGAQSAAIIAETYDQVGKYKEAREFANYDEGVKQLRKLEQEIGRLKPMRNAVRAHAWLILQSGVNEFRREGGGVGVVRGVVGGGGGVGGRGWGWVWVWRGWCGGGCMSISLGLGSFLFY